MLHFNFTDLLLTKLKFILMEAETIRVLFTKFISFIRKRIRSNKTQTQSQTTLTPISVPKPNPPIDESASFHLSLQASMNEIIKATKNFSCKLIVGRGSFGLVYKAELPNGLKLAVKNLDPRAFQGFMEFRWEHEILGKLRHRNIAPLLGYCISGANRILITEFYEMGSLENQLHDLSLSSFYQNHMLSYSRSPLSWEARYKIVIGVAKGLAYMHDLDKPIIHRNIKASNILLDSNFDAHIADFGFARMIERHHTHVTTQPAVGAPYYMPPEYEDGCTVATTSGDVYSFGVLMLEVATGKRPTAPMYFTKEISFMQGVRTMVGKNQEMKILDRNISTSDTACVRKYFRIAIMCTNVNRSDRPAMRDVVEFLTKN